MQSEQEKSAYKKNTANYVLSLSVFFLAAALVYLAWQIGVVSRQIPDILKQIEQTSSKIEPVVKQFNEIKVLIPPVMNEVSEIRKQVPLILQEVKFSREQLPHIIDEVQATRKQLPAILQAVDKASSAAEVLAEEVKATRPLVPRILAEVKTTREAIPHMLDRADKLILNAKEAGKEASKGAVTGVLTGIITTPFDLIDSLGKKISSFSDEEIEELTETDIELAKKAIHQVLFSDNINYSKSWSNPDSEVAGKITLLDIKMTDGQSCKIINFQTWKLSKNIVDKNMTLCLNNEGSWEKKE